MYGAHRPAHERTTLQLWRYQPWQPPRSLACCMQAGRKRSPELAREGREATQRVLGERGAGRPYHPSPVCGPSEASNNAPAPKPILAATTLACTQTGCECSPALARQGRRTSSKSTRKLPLSAVAGVSGLLALYCTQAARERIPASTRGLLQLCNSRAQQRMAQAASTHPRRQRPPLPPPPLPPAFPEL